MKPFLSILLIMCLLFGIAFIKMENRRMGYSFVKLAEKEKELRNKQRQKSLELDRLLSPQRVQRLAIRKLSMKKAGKGQVIHMSSKGVAIKR